MASALFSAARGDWRTPQDIISRVKAFFGGEIDLDPATSAAANELIGARQIYTADDDGLSRPWLGKVFVNPPGCCPWVQTEKPAYSVDAKGKTTLVSKGTGYFQVCKNDKVCACKLPQKFWAKLAKEYGKDRTKEAVWLGFSLNQLATLQLRFDEGDIPVPSPMTHAICVLRSRLAFLDPSTGKAVPNPTQFNYLAYLGTRDAEFRAYFSDLGAVK